jgi:hypothetical protein
MKKLILVLVLLLGGCSTSESLTPLEKQIAVKFEEASDEDLENIQKSLKFGELTKGTHEPTAVKLMNAAREDAVKIVGPEINSRGAKFMPAVKKMLKRELKKR